MFNTFTDKTKTIGGSLPVWLEVNGTKLGGCVIDTNEYAVGDVIPAGTLVFGNSREHYCAAAHIYKNAAAAENGKVYIYLDKACNDSKSPQVDDVIWNIKDGAFNETSTVKSVLDDTNAIGVNATAAMNESDYWVTFNKNTNGKMNPGDDDAFWGFTENDVYIEDGTTAATVAVVDDGRIYIDRVAKIIPAFVSDKVPNIHFEYELKA
jgi:hypothetical protein